MIRHALTIARRDLATYFTQPAAYVILVLFSVVTGYLFFMSVLTYYSISMRYLNRPYMASVNPFNQVIQPLFGNISVLLLLVVPILTMRLLAEEKKSGTIELTLSYPVRDGAVVAGKYLGALAMLGLMLGLTGFYLLVLRVYFGLPLDWGPIVSGYAGLFLMGSACVALGLFASSLTENQVVAAMITFACVLLFWTLDWLAGYATVDTARLVSYLSIVGHLRSFTKGVINTADVAYYLLFIFFFLFLTFRVLEARRWRGARQ